MAKPKYPSTDEYNATGNAFEGVSAPPDIPPEPHPELLRHTPEQADPIGMAALAAEAAAKYLKLDDVELPHELLATRVPLKGEDLIARYWFTIGRAKGLREAAQLVERPYERRAPRVGDRWIYNMLAGGSFRYTVTTVDGTGDAEDTVFLRGERGEHDVALTTVGVLRRHPAWDLDYNDTD